VTGEAKGRFEDRMKRVERADHSRGAKRFQAGHLAKEALTARDRGRQGTGRPVALPERSRRMPCRVAVITVNAPGGESAVPGRPALRVSPLASIAASPLVPRCPKP